VVSFTPRQLYPGERAPGTHWIGGPLGPREGPNDTEKWKFLPPPGLELWLLGRAASRYTDCAIPVLHCNCTHFKFRGTIAHFKSSLHSQTFDCTELHSAILMPQFLNSTPPLASRNSTASLPFILNHFRLPSQKTPSIFLSTARDPRYTASGQPQRKTPFPLNSALVIEVRLPRRWIEKVVLLLRFRGNLFTESLPSNGRLLWLYYSGFRASCHNIINPTIPNTK
jgi:hypothetical protein